MRALAGLTGRIGLKPRPVPGLVYWVLTGYYPELIGSGLMGPARNSWILLADRAAELEEGLGSEGLGQLAVHPLNCRDANGGGIAVGLGSGSLIIPPE